MRDRSRNVFIGAFLSPALAIYAFFVLYPLLQAVLFSTYRWRGLSQNKQFVGLENFRNLLADPVFWQAVKNNLWLLFVAGAVALAISVGVATGARGKSRLSRTLRGVYLFPQVISLVVVAILWYFVFSPEIGLLNGGLRAIGLDSLAKPWLGQPSTALAAVGIAFVWYVSGFYVMLFAAGIQSIPSEVFEAAELDGAHGFRRFRAVIWPMLWSVKRIAVVYMVINVMNVFALVLLMTRGGPDRKTEVMLTYLYEQAFTNSQFGYATSLAVANFVTIMVLSLGILFYFRRNPMEARQ